MALVRTGVVAASSLTFSFLSPLLTAFAGDAAALTASVLDFRSRGEASGFDFGLDIKGNSGAAAADGAAAGGGGDGGGEVSSFDPHRCSRQQRTTVIAE
jgi:hypothetical protein